MRRGRKSKPTELKRRAGNPGRRPLPADEPRAEPKAPTCPRHLDREARREWRRIVKELTRLGIVTQLDRGVLIAYCESWSLYLQAQVKVREEGAVLISDKGRPYDSPHLNQMRGALKDLVRYAAEMGLTPSSRSGVQAQPPKTERDKSRLFKICG